MSDLGSWLQERGLADYIEVFARERIRLTDLPDLTDEDLRELGLPMGPRKQLLRAASALSKGSPGPQRPEANRTGTARPDDAERRQLTVVFCDLAESTPLSRRLDPEELRDVVLDFQQACKAVIERFDGFVARYMGDGILAYFGYPRGQEDAAELAVRAGLGLVEAVAGLGHRVRDEGELVLCARVGVATGLVVVGDSVGEGASEERAVTGETPNLAARLQSLAEPGTVVLADVTRRLVGDLFDYVDLGRCSLKGFDEPLRAWRAVAERAVTSRFEATRAARGLTPLVGREEERDLLARRWQQIRSGEGQVVTIGGDPGIGKSRLVENLIADVVRDPHTLARYYCSPHLRNSPLAPVVVHLERAASLAPGDPAETRLDKVEALLAGDDGASEDHVRLLASLLDIPTGERYAPLNLSSERWKEGTFDMLEARLADLAQRAPVLIVYEDVHWMDPTSLELVERLVEQIAGLPVLALLTHRPGFDAPWAGSAHVTALALNRLSRARIAQIVTGLAGGRRLPEAVLEQIIARTDGVPLFVEELTKSILEAGGVGDAEQRHELVGSAAPFAIPETLKDSLTARLDRLAEAKEVAQIGATIGRRFSDALIAEIAPLAPELLQVGLERLVAAGLVHRRGTAPESTYTFKHALVQDAAYDSLLYARRRELHARIVQVLEEGTQSLGASSPEILAHHYQGAELFARAAERWLAAGERASARAAFVEAEAHLGAGLALIAKLEPGVERERLEMRLERGRWRPIHANRGNSAPEVGSALERARVLCKRLGESDEFAHTTAQLSLFHMLRGELDQALALAEELLEETRSAPESMGFLWALRALGYTQLMRGELHVARQHLERGRTMRQPRGEGEFDPIYDVVQNPSMAGNLAIALCLTGDVDGATAVAQGMIARVEAADDFPLSVCWALIHIAELESFLGQHDAYGQRARRVLAIATERKLPQLSALARTFLGASTVARGELKEGLSVIELAVHELRTIGARVYQPWLEATLAECYAADGRAEEALSLLDAALAELRIMGVRREEPEILRRKGALLAQHPASRAEGLACLERALALARGSGAALWELRTTMSLVGLRGEGNDPDAGRRLLRAALRRFEGSVQAIPDVLAARALLAGLEQV